LRCVEMSSNEYSVEYAKTGRSSCKDTKCKKKIGEGSIRIAKIFDSPFGDDKQTHWYHPKCIWNYFSRAKGSTKKVESTDDLQGFDDLSKADQKTVEALIASGGKSGGGGSKKRKTPATKSSTKGKSKKKKKDEDEDEDEEEEEEEEEDGDDEGGSDLIYLEADTKFWECRLQGKKAFVRWGKVGNDGQSDEKSFPTAEKARKFAEKKQKEKEKKGYEVAEGGGGGGGKKTKKSSTKGKKKEKKEKSTSKKSGSKKSSSKKSSSKKSGGGVGKRI